MLLSLALSFVSASHATIYGGNPQLFLSVDRPEHDLASVEVDLDKVRMHHCQGGYTDYEVDGAVDLVEGHVLAISAGDYCGITVYWASVMTLYGVNDAYVLEYDDATDALSIGSTIPPVSLAPFEVVLGTIYGGNPVLSAIIE